jgi:Tc5 transposase DNA-binding domain
VISRDILKEKAA